MTSEQYVFWLQGFFELSESNTLSEKQVEVIKNHLKLVFYHEIDPSYSSDPKVQEEMQMIHDGRTNITGELIIDRPSTPVEDIRNRIRENNHSGLSKFGTRPGKNLKAKC